MELEQHKNRLALWGIALLGLLACADEAYAGFKGLSDGHPVAVVWKVAFVVLSVYWGVNDARMRRIGSPFTDGVLMFFFMPIMLPIYLIKSRGGKGALLVLAGVVVYILPMLCWVLGDGLADGT